MSYNFEDHLLSDDPLAELDDELFGRSHLVERVIEVLGHVRKQSTSSTVGLVGAWGSGKSSVLTNVLSRIRINDAKTSTALNGESWLVTEFNPWLFADPHALHAGFFTMLRDAFPSTKKWTDVRGKVIELGRYVAPAAGLVTAVFGGDGEQAASKLIDQFELSAVEQHDAISKKLDELKQPVLIVVDDLDRLTAAELLEVFKLVRLVGRLPYVYYVLGYDEHTLVDLLAKTDLVSANDDRRALEYLEKIVQVRLDMPLLRPFEIDRVVDRTLTSLARKHRVSLDEETSQTLSRLFDGVMSKRLRTPRSLKRLFGQIDAFLPSVGNEVRYGDYVVMTWLRTMEPGVYDLVQRRRHELLDIEPDAERIREAPNRGGLSEARQQWLKDLIGAHVARGDAEDVLWLLGTLFPVLADVYRGSGSPLSHRAREERPGRVGNPDYFDRFFAFGVPPDDIPDALAGDGLAQIVAGNVNGSHAQSLATAFGRDPHLTMRKISQSYDETRSSSATLVTWAAERWRHSSDSLLRGRLETFTAKLFSDLTAVDAAASSESLLKTDEGLLLASHLRAILDNPSYAREAPPETHDAAAAALSSALDAFLPQRFTELANEYASPLSLPREIAIVATRWRLSDQAGHKKFLATVVPSQWGWIDCLMWLAPVTTVDGGETYRLRSDARWTQFHVLDLKAAIQDLGDTLSSAPALHTLPAEAEATDEVRRNFALAVLRQTAAWDEELESENLSAEPS